MNNKNLPNFLIVGAPKAGTSSIAKYLDAHPEIFIPKIKEPRYFLYDIFEKISKDDPLYSYLMETSVLDWEKYVDLYQNTDAFVHKFGDASVQYLYHHETVIPKIKEKLGDVPIIIVLRDPTDRAFSNYSYQNMVDFLTFEQSLDNELLRRNNNYNSFWFYRDLGNYFNQVKAYMDSFSKVYICKYEDLQNDPEALMKDIFSFLGVNNNFRSDYKKRHNETKKPKNKFVKYIYYLKNKNNIKMNFLPMIMRKNISNILFSTKKNKIDSKTKEELRGYYKNDIMQLEKLLSKDFSSWYL